MLTVAAPASSLTAAAVIGCPHNTSRASQPSKRDPGDGSVADHREVGAPHRPRRRDGGESVGDEERHRDRHPIGHLAGQNRGIPRAPRPRPRPPPRLRRGSGRCTRCSGTRRPRTHRRGRRSRRSSCTAGPRAGRGASTPRARNRRPAARASPDATSADHHAPRRIRMKSIRSPPGTVPHLGRGGSAHLPLLPALHGDEV